MKSRNLALRQMIDEACTASGDVSRSFASKPIKPLEQVRLLARFSLCDASLPATGGTQRRARLAAAGRARHESSCLPAQVSKGGTTNRIDLSEAAVLVSGSTIARRESDLVKERTNPNRGKSSHSGFDSVPSDSEGIQPMASDLSQ